DQLAVVTKTWEGIMNEASARREERITALERERELKKLEIDALTAEVQMLRIRNQILEQQLESTTKELSATRGFHSRLGHIFESAEFQIASWKRQDEEAA